MTLVDEALSKICEIGTVGAMKWLYKQSLEQCAKLCLETDTHPDHGEVSGDFLAGHIWGCEDCAAAILARGEK